MSVTHVEKAEMAATNSEMSLKPTRNSWSNILQLIRSTSNKATGQQGNGATGQ